MFVQLFLVLTVVGGCFNEDVVEPSTDKGSVDISNGWGAKYNWVSGLELALQRASANQRPVMVIIHKSWCGACKNLKKLFAADEEILELSEHFEMVNLGDNDEPKEAKFKPDGGYIPRIFFLHPDGTLLKDIINEAGNEKYKYYHFSPDTILTAMEKVLDLSSKWSEQPKEEL